MRIIRTTRIPVHATLNGERRQIGTAPVTYIADDETETFTVIPPELAERFQDDEEAP